MDPCLPPNETSFCIIYQSDQEWEFDLNVSGDTITKYMSTLDDGTVPFDAKFVLGLCTYAYSGTPSIMVTVGNLLSTDDPTKAVGILQAAVAEMPSSIKSGHGLYLGASKNELGGSSCCSLIPPAKPVQLQKF
jgi:hypothetical protein